MSQAQVSKTVDKTRQNAFDFWLCRALLGLLILLAAA